MMSDHRSKVDSKSIKSENYKIINSISKICSFILNYFSTTFLWNILLIICFFYDLLRLSRPGQILQSHQINRATSPPSDVSVKNTDEEMTSAMEIDECSATENGGEPEKKDLSETEPETEDTFKKPALFAAPSRASKHGNVAASSKPTAADTKCVKENNKAEVVETTSDTSTGPVNEKEISEKQQEKDKKSEKDKDVSTVKTKPDAKSRVLPAKGPPAGKFPPLPYTEPPWGGRAPDIPYALEILKNGTIVDKVPLTHRSFFVVGRLPVCDVFLEHPSISRYHAVIQFRGQAGEGECVGEERGFYIHDLGSTHGTVVNKNNIPPKTYIRLRVGHVLKFGGSTRLFILQGPEFDEEEESELTVTELKERSRKQKAELEKRMMGDGSDDEEDEKEKGGEDESNKCKSKLANEDSGCSWGMAEDVVPEEDENEENPFSTEFHEDQEAAYLKDPKKALQGFYDREGEELEFEYEDKSHGTWLCRIKLPVDDAMGRQLVAEVTHTGKKKEAAIQCCLEACRMLEARGLLRQEAVSRKRKKKNWEDEDYYDSDDDTFLDRTGTVERKREERMKKAGKIEERPETYESLVAKLSEVEKELEDTQKKLSAGRGDSCGSSTEDPLDAFMTAVRSEAAMDAVERRKLHVHIADLRKDAQRLRKLVELTRPAQMPSLLPSGSSESEKPKKTLPLFGAMKGGSKFKLKTGTIGKLPPKRPNLPAELFNMKELPPSGEEEEEDEEEEEAEKNEDMDDKHSTSIAEPNVEESIASMSQESTRSGQRGEQPVQSHELKEHSRKERRGAERAEAVEQVPEHRSNKAQAPSPKSRAEGDREPAADLSPRKKKKGMGPSRPPVQLSGQYPEDDPDYSVWVPPAGQTGDGRTHLNDKYGY
ncbi:kanadaptin [Xiphias gladius]|uniref:kanadaptin n=1 Tax=Xiphias gladius TaxID=8245 RepID=UPI001A998B28|nr:kanadaptin [Xiphias gladius]